MNRALLLKDLNLKVDLPEGHLCPAIPNRTEYLRQIEFILKNVFNLSSEIGVTVLDMYRGSRTDGALINSLVELVFHVFIHLLDVFAIRIGPFLPLILMMKF